MAQLVKNMPAILYLGSILVLGRSPREGKGYPLQYSGLENSMDSIAHGVSKSQTQLSDFRFHFSLSLSSLIIGASLVAQWQRICLQMQELEVSSLDWEDPLERERLPTPVFWPGEFHGLYNPWGHKESDMTEQLSLTLTCRQSHLCSLQFVFALTVVLLTDQL